MLIRRIRHILPDVLEPVALCRYQIGDVFAVTRMGQVTIEFECQA